MAVCARKGLRDTLKGGMGCIVKGCVFIESHGTGILDFKAVWPKIWHIQAQEQELRLYPLGWVPGGKVSSKLLDLAVSECNQFV